MLKKCIYYAPDTKCLDTMTEVTFCHSGNIPGKLEEGDLFDEEFN